MLTQQAALTSANRWQFKTELLERLGIIGALGGVKYFDADNAALVIVIDNDAVGDFGAVLDGPVGQVEVDRIRRLSTLRAWLSPVEVGGDYVFRIVTRRYDAQHNMPAGQALKERSAVSSGFRLVGIEDRALDPFFRYAAALDLKFGVLVVADHWRRPYL